MDEEVAVEPAPIHRNAPLQDEKKRQQQQGTLPASPPYSSCRFTTKPDANQPRKQKRMKTISIHLFLAMECEVEVPAHHVSPENMSIILPVRCRDQEDRKWSEAIPVASLGTYIEDVVVMRAWYSHSTWQNCPPFGPCCMWRQRFDLVRTVSQRERERERYRGPSRLFTSTRRAAHEPSRSCAHARPNKMYIQRCICCRRAWFRRGIRASVIGRQADKKQRPAA
jgi:hypothetical protein